ncbi:MAG: cytochrome c peroxidase [Steroidobacteraceae bacterium]
MITFPRPQTTRTAWPCSSGVLLLLLAGCGGGSSSTDPTTPPAQPALSDTARLGELIFKDESLSASGRMACQTCHDPAHAHAGPPPDPVSPGGPELADRGLRNSPSIRYASLTPAFHFEADGTPVGGFFRDGRAASLADQAHRPFFEAREMAIPTVEILAQKLRSADYVSEFMRIFGADVFDDPQRALDSAAFALARYQIEDREFHRFDSKYDAFLAGTTTLTPQELRGLALFNDPAKGNCAACHPSARAADGSPPLFTDFTYDNLGVPRNPAIPANADPSYHDLGLCGPQRSDLANRPDLCGAFKVPSLRNVASTAPYFHNGRFQTLAEVVAFYVRRDTNPEEWYPTGATGIEKFDDLPPDLRRNVNTTEAPYNRPIGGSPALSPEEIADVVAFLETLSDGYTP